MMIVNQFSITSRTKTHMLMLIAYVFQFFISYHRSNGNYLEDRASVAIRMEYFMIENKS